jgi:hypothetical protein
MLEAEAGLCLRSCEICLKRPTRLFFYSTTTTEFYSLLLKVVFWPKKRRLFFTLSIGLSFQSFFPSPIFPHCHTVNSRTSLLQMDRFCRFDFRFNYIYLSAINPRVGCLCTLM